MSLDAEGVRLARVPFPTFAIGPSISVLSWARSWQQSRRKVKLTVHSAYRTHAMAAFVGGTRAVTAEGPDPGIIEVGGDEYFVTVTNASRTRDIVVTHVWFETTPPVHLTDPELPVRLKYSEPWETSVLVEKVPADPERAPWLARCLLSPDGKVVKSRPRKNVPPMGTVPRQTR